MVTHIEIYLNTEYYSKESILKSIHDHISTLGTLCLRDKISNSLPNKVSFLRIENELSRNFPKDTNRVYYIVPPLEPASPSEEFISDGENSSTSSHNWILPNEGFDGLWESLYLSNNVKQNLLRFATISLKFGDKGVNPNIILCNRLIFLHGPPGTGKTTICKAIAQKLSIRLMETHPLAQLVEINCHSLLSKWFSESGKLVTKLFENIRSYASDPKMLVVVLIDEVESLTSARQTAINSNEPSDAIRVVNAVLTQLDSLRFFPNVLILATSNLSEAIDPAFTDRADFVQLIGLPAVTEIAEILQSIFTELEKAAIFPEGSLTGADASHVAELCVGLSGRAIRKLPIVALALGLEDEPTPSNFLKRHLVLAIMQMKSGTNKSP